MTEPTITQHAIAEAGFTDPFFAGAHAYTIQQPSAFQGITITAGKTKVTIKADGTIEYGEGCTPDAAAKAFWEVVGRYHPISRVIEACAKICDGADQTTLADRIRDLPRTSA